MASDRDPSRRRDVLKGLAAGGVTFLAGCGSSSEDGGDGGSGSDGGSGGDGDGGSGSDGGSDGGDGDDMDGGDGDDGTATSAGVESRTIRTGILAAVSGPLSQAGPPIRDGMQAAANFIDENSDTFSVEHQFADTATDPNQGISQANSLVDQGFPMVAGAIASSVTIQAATNVFVPNEVVVCSPTATSPELTTLDDNGYVFRTVGTDALQGQAMAQLGRDRLDGETAVVVAQNDAYGQGIAGAFADSWEARGGTIQRQVAFEVDQSSYSSQWSQALQDQPDVTAVVTFPESGIQLFRDYYADFSQEFTDMVAANGIRLDSLPNDIGNSMRNVRGVSPVAQGPSRDFFEQQYTQRVGSVEGKPFVSNSWDAMVLLCLANAAAGENSGPAIRDQVRNVANGPGAEIAGEGIIDGLEMAARGEEINYQGAAGPVTLDENGDVTTVNFEIWRFQQDGSETVGNLDFEPT